MTVREHAEVIRGFLDKKIIQYRNKFHSEYPWNDWQSESLPDFNNQYLIWRIKPQTIKYRRFLWESELGVWVGIHNESLNMTPKHIEKVVVKSFIRWIDQDWIEQEI